MITVRKTQFVLVTIAFLHPLCSDLRCDAAPAEVGNDLQGKVFCGYQGWFGTPDDGTPIGFDNYRYDGVFKPGMCVIDYWPDLREFGEDEKYPTEFRHQDSAVAHVFSAANPKTVDRHFRWMKDYGIDGVFLQRFGWALKQPKTLIHRNRVLQNVQQSAKQQGRLWALMYDLTSLEAGDIEEYVIPDIRQLIQQGGLERDPSYARFNGQPIVAVWGIGFRGDRAYSLNECQQLVEFLKNDPVCGGKAVMLGVPYYWQDQKHDAVSDPLFHQVLRQADIVSPWSVGRYRTIEQAQAMMSSKLTSDILWTSQHRLGYLPVIFPGFSWHNLKAAEREDKPLDEIPRMGGRFLWSQATEVQQAGLDMVYVAMFDEMNEGTCVFKCTDDPPAGESRFLTYAVDQLPSDHYLWLSGQIGRLLRGELPAPHALPQRSSR
jgi:hypothetical protein